MYTQTGRGIVDFGLWFMIAIFALVGGGILLLGIYTLANTLRVDVSPRGLLVTRRFFGVPFASHIPFDDIASIEPHIGSQSKSNDEFRVRYTLRLMRRNGRRATVGEDIPGRRLAEHLAQQLRERCGLKTSHT